MVNYSLPFFGAGAGAGAGAGVSGVAGRGLARAGLCDLVDLPETAVPRAGLADVQHALRGLDHDALAATWAVLRDPLAVLEQRIGHVFLERVERRGQLRVRRRRSRGDDPPDLELDGLGPVALAVTSSLAANRVRLDRQKRGRVGRHPAGL
jgi:hypothetical protein